MSFAVVSQIIVGILGLISLWLKEYYSVSAKDKRDARSIQDKRQDILDDDIPAVESRIDRLFSQDSGNARITSDKVTEERISTILGLAPDKFSDSKNAGTSGKVPR